MNDNAPKSNATLIFFSIAVALIIGLGIFAAYILNPDTSTKDNQLSTNTQAQVMEKDGRQFVKVSAKNGFFPNTINLKSGIPTTLSVETKNTYDCSSYIVIPDLKVSKALPISGETPIEIPAQSSGTKMTATCGMGHYPLTLNFINS